MVSIVVPNIPKIIVSVSVRLSFSLIKINARIAAKTGPVVNDIVEDKARGIKAIAAYWHDLDIKLSSDLRNNILI